MGKDQRRKRHGLDTKQNRRRKVKEKIALNKLDEKLRQEQPILIHDSTGLLLEG